MGVFTTGNLSLTALSFGNFNRQHGTIAENMNSFHLFPVGTPEKGVYISALQFTDLGRT